MYTLAQTLRCEPGLWMHSAAKRMRVYEFIVEADQYGACCQDPMKAAVIREAMLALVRAAMTAAPAPDPDSIPQELLLAMTFLADPWMEEDVGARVEALCASAGVALTCTADASVGLHNIFRSSSDHEPLAPCGEHALRNQVQPKLYLLSHSESAWKQVACLFLYNWEHDRPTQVVRECAVAMYAINPALFHSVYKDVVAEAADGSEAYEVAEGFWRACGFPGTCFTH